MTFTKDIIYQKVQQSWQMHSKSHSTFFYWYHVECSTRSAMLHNPDNYPNPEEFKPERFMKEGAEILDPFTAGVFGFGRRCLFFFLPSSQLNITLLTRLRICPGSHVAQSILYIIAASFLSLFDVKPVLDDDGRPIEVKPEFTTASLQS